MRICEIMAYAIMYSYIRAFVHVYIANILVYTFIRSHCHISWKNALYTGSRYHYTVISPLPRTMRWALWPCWRRPRSGFGTCSPRPSHRRMNSERCVLNEGSVCSNILTTKNGRCLGIFSTTPIGAGLSAATPMKTTSNDAYLNMWAYLQGVWRS